MKKNVLTLLCLLWGLSISAAPITREQAKKNVLEFLKTAKGSRQLAPVSNRAKLAPRRGMTQATTTELYYVFNRGEGEGYVIASGDDQTLPVLGYTDEGEFDYTKLPDNMRAWLDSREDQLRWLSQHPEVDASAPRRIPVHAAISPMVTTLWNQGAPYNDECPMYFTLGRSVTGCVATAMAQVLYFQHAKSVTETQADIPAYDTNTSHETYGKLHVEGIPSGSPIDWDNMLDSYNSNSTAKQKLAVAQLMHYCGVSVQMDYTNSSSGAYSSNVDDAFRNYFGYGSSVQCVSQTSYSEEQWDALLYRELALGRPFYLSGSNASAGHAFVCDGYDGNHCFHINWGWGGDSNGHFLLTSLNPSSQGIGGSGDGYSQYEEAVIGCEPENYLERAVPFSTPLVKELCTAAWDTDGNGVFTFGEATAVTDLGSVFKGQNITSFNELYNFTGLTTIGDDAFSGCNKLTAIKLPKGLRTIGARAFADCRMLRSLTLPNGMTAIGDSAFANCRMMGNLMLPSGIIRIENNTFEKCLAFTAVEMPIGIQYIGKNAFAGCTKLTEVTVNSVTPKDIVLGESVFDGITLSKATLHTLQGTRSYFMEAEQWKEFGNLTEERNLAQGTFVPLEANKKFFLYNVGTGYYLTKGEAYGTQAVVANTYEPMRFELRRNTTMPEGTYYLYSIDTGNANRHILFRSNSDDMVGTGIWACFVDGSLSANAYWKVAPVEGRECTYTLQTPSNGTGYEEGKFMGVQPSHASNVAVPTYGIYSDVSYDEYPYNCQWMLVPYNEESLANYQMSQQLRRLLNIAKARNITATREQAIYDNDESTIEEMETACRKLRKKMNLINFVDETFGRIAIENFDVDCDGELSFTEAACVEYIDAQYTGNTSLTDLSDLQYFTALQYTTGTSFKGCSNLKKVIVPRRVTGIFYQSFMNCSKLESVSVSRNVTIISDNAFYGCAKLKEFRIEVTDPATISLSSTAFSGISLSKAILYVPQGSKERYAQANIWKNFGEIREMRCVGEDTYIPLSEAEETEVYIYNLAYRKQITKGEAYGTQAVVATEGFPYQLRRTASMPENTYYLYSEQTGTTNKVLFRTTEDSKVGVGIKACFIDGQLSSSAYWKVVPVEGRENVYTLQVPEDDKSYVAGEYLGVNTNHDTDYTYGETYGLYWDIPYEENAEKCHWAFASVAARKEKAAFFEQTQHLLRLLQTAKKQDIEASAEQSVYDNFDSSEQEIQDAIKSLRAKLHYIDFTDNRARALCVEAWDKDEDDELSLEEAAAVTDIGTTFRSIAGMKSFDELRYFTSLTSLPDEAFRATNALISLYIPEGVTTLGTKALYSTTALKYLAVLSPTTVVDASAASLSSKLTVFVPEALVEAYTADAYWGKCTILPFTGIPTITADEVSREYGRTNPKISYEVSGAPINGTPTLSLDAAMTSPVGDYDIVVNAGTVTTPDVQYVNGMLHVNPAPLTITAKSYTRNRGEDNPEFELTYSSFRNHETAEVLDPQPVVECDATPDSPAGDYEIRVSGAQSPNYVITYVSGTLTVLTPDGIEQVRNEEGEKRAIYDISGRKVNSSSFILHPSSLKKGLYIVNGRKVVIK